MMTLSDWQAITDGDVIVVRLTYQDYMLELSDPDVDRERTERRQRTADATREHVARTLGPVTFG